MSIAIGGNDRMYNDSQSRFSKRNRDFESDAYSERESYMKRDKRHVVRLNTSLQPPGYTDFSFSKQESLVKSEYSFDTGRNRHGDEESYIGDESQENYSKFYKSEASYIVTQEEIEKLDWKDLCLKIIDKIEEYEESEDFKRPVTEQELGELWPEYQRIISYPIDLTSIRAKMYEGEYVGVGNFEYDFRQIFANCKKFNEEGSGIVENSNFLEEKFDRMFKPVKKRFGEIKKFMDANIRITMDGFNF